MDQDVVSKLTKTQDDIVEIVITNIFKMLVSRQLIESSSIKQYVVQGVKNYDQNYETVITLSKKDAEKINSPHLSIKFILRKISALKETDVEQFLKKTHYKFILLSDMQARSVRQKLEKKQNIDNIQNIEVFDIDDLKLDLFECDFIPYQRKLNANEISDVTIAYKLAKNNMKQMCYDDPVARYLNLKPGDIVEIKRPSITCGYEIDYRIVSIHAQP